MRKTIRLYDLSSSRFRDALAKLGWTEGRWAAGDPGRMKTLAKELVELRPDAILGHTTSVTSTLMREI